MVTLGLQLKELLSKSNLLEAALQKCLSKAKKAKSTKSVESNKVTGSKTNNVTKNKGKRRKNRVPDKGEPNTVAENSAGTTRKSYGSDGNVQKEWNKGHGPKFPKNEQNDHIHDYKPNPYNPSGLGERMPGRKPRPRDLYDMNLF